MSRWWRAHACALEDPKLQRLPGEIFKAWFNLLCIASMRDGVLPPLADVAFALRKPEAATAKILNALKAAGLLDDTDAGLMPHNWNGRQYKSDVSNERVKRHRERQRNGECNVTVTPSESESESEADTEQNSVAKATGAKAPPRDVIFAECLPWMIRKTGKTRQDAAKIIGKWCGEYGDEAVMAAMQQAEQENPVDPIPWIVAKFKPRETWNEKRIREGMAVIMGCQQ